MKASRILKRARRSAGMTQRELARESGIPQPAIARIESGKVVPRISTIERLINACGYSLELAPRRGAGVDRSLMRELLKLTPAERADRAVEASNTMSAILGR